MSQPTMTPPQYALTTTALITISVIFISLATIAVVLRFYARRIKALKVGWDDWTILITLVCALQEVDVSKAID